MERFRGYYYPYYITNIVPHNKYVTDYTIFVNKKAGFSRKFSGNSALFGIIRYIPIAPYQPPEQTHSFSGPLAGGFSGGDRPPHFKKIGTHPSVVSEPLK
jgi:hypothetical protein